MFMTTSSSNVLTAIADLEREYPAMMLRLREQVTRQLEDDRWMYEPVSHFHSGLP